MTETPKRPLDRLLAIMARLRDPAGGCPWDREQTFATIAPYTIEEAYEVAEAIARGDMAELKDELGDLLFQVVFHSRMAEEAGAFAFADVADAISDKMERRHPHVFGDLQIRDADHQSVVWEQHKARERAAKAERGETTSAGALSGVPLALPALLRAEKLGKRAARVRFDWSEARSVAAKVREELEEIEAAVADNEPEDRITHEVGDLLFAAAQLARHLKVNPETALREANARFERRFGHIERTLAALGRSPQDAGSDELERLWGEAKDLEKKR
ncbi:MAG: nucleoside triphosphate pyrophosphohydrolase [Rhodospirillaceae bacterium]|nr:nucleoside triphosphate pyrophosphohydrolase [Rhodospirillaceae bacterium]